MLPDLIAGLPDWLLAGVALGAVVAVGLAVVFAVGVRAFPQPARRFTDREGGERRRRAEIRRYLASIGEPYREDHVIAGLSAAFYLPDRDVAITFDARDYFRFQRAGITAVLLEYELPGANLGSRLPFETPLPGRSGGSDRDTRDRWERVRAPRMDTSTRATAAFRALGLPPDATPAEVTEAYRERVKDVHPDHGGDAESFRRLREAYTVARERTG